MNEDKILLKYFYYYLYSNIHFLEREFRGLTIQHLNKEKLKKIKIYYPSIEKQQQYIDEFEEFYFAIKDLVKIVNFF